MTAHEDYEKMRALAVMSESYGDFCAAVMLDPADVSDEMMQVQRFYDVSRNAARCRVKARLRATHER